jgi:predicted RNase H-like HicB family nuclease
MSVIAYSMNDALTKLVSNAVPLRVNRVPSGKMTASRERRMQFTAVFQQVAEGYIAFVEELPGANTQGATLEEARENLAEAVELVLASNRTIAEESIEGRHVIRESFPWRAA